MLKPEATHGVIGWGGIGEEGRAIFAGGAPLMAFSREDFFLYGEEDST